MDKETFLQQLKMHLSVLDEEDIAEIIEEYRLLIEEKRSLGFSEEEIIQKFGSPQKIAEGYIVELLGEKGLAKVQEKNQKDLIYIQKESNKNLALFIILQIFHIFVLIPAILGVIGTLYGLGIAGIALLFSAGTTIFAPFSVGIKVLAGLFIFSIGILLLNLTIFLSMAIYKIAKRYTLWNISLIQ